MSKRLALCLAVLLWIAAPGSGNAATRHKRLVSLAPSLTEMLFDLGAGESVVGVTIQCLYPPEALAIPKIGMYQAPSVEAILALQPDAVLALQEHAPIFPMLDQVGLQYEVFDHRSLAGLLDSFTRIGLMCDRMETAQTLRNQLEQAFTPTQTSNLPSLLFIIGRDQGRGMISNACVIGDEGLYSLLIQAAGARNAYSGPLPYPVLSGEGIAALAPDIIVEADYHGSGATAETDWNAIATLPAVRNHAVFPIKTDSVFVPGMRLLAFKKHLEECIARTPSVEATTP